MYLMIPLLAVAKARARITRWGAYTPKKTVDFENAIRRFWKSSGNEMFPNVPIKLDIICYISRPKKPKNKLPITRPDVDNYAKSIKDALNGMAWKDDSFVTDLRIKKRYVDKDMNPAIHISITKDEGDKV